MPHTDGGASLNLILLEIVPQLRLAFALEPLGLLFALVASGLWVVTSIYSIGYMRAHHEAHQTRFYTCFALTLGAAMGIALAGNLVTLFVFYEAMTLVTYPLVTHYGTETAVRAGRVYLGYLLGTSIGLLLLAVTWTWILAGTLDFQKGGFLAGKADRTTLLVLLALYAFGIGKAALMPFHRWLPAAMVAPTPVSALLHAVAVVKAGVFSVMKIVLYVFGTDLLHETGLSVWLMYVAGATILIASLIALIQDDLKARLAYSTVSQLSYIVLGAALANPAGILGGSMHILMHAFGKITLFFCAGAIAVTTHEEERLLRDLQTLKDIGWSFAAWSAVRGWRDPEGRAIQGTTAGATSGPISVTAPAGSATSSTSFVVTATSGAPRGASPGSRQRGGRARRCFWTATSASRGPGWR